MARGALAGRCIVVTRPRELAAEFAALIEQAGGAALIFPAIEIRDLEDPGPAIALLGRLEEFELAVFISRSAVRKALGLAGVRAWPARLRVAASGAGTRRELEQHGFGEVIAPAAPAGSEALLALPEMRDLAGRRVVIFRGMGGRELLGEALAARGASVEYAECYRRVRPEADAAPLLAAWSRSELDAVSVSSGEALANLCGMLGETGRQWLAATALFVPHARVAGQARALGLREVVPAGPSDVEMLARMVAYFNGAK